MTKEEVRRSINEIGFFRTVRLLIGKAIAEFKRASEEDQGGIERNLNDLGFFRTLRLAIAEAKMESTAKRDSSEDFTNAMNKFFELRFNLNLPYMIFNDPKSEEVDAMYHQYCKTLRIVGDMSPLPLINKRTFIEGLKCYYEDNY